MNKTRLLEHLKKQGFSKKILDAFVKVKREKFVPKDLENSAYEDKPLPIGGGQTISQPYTIAFMLDILELNAGQKVLELGSGCGYVLALISEIVGKKGKVYGVEIVKSLAEKSQINLRNYANVKIYNRNGREGIEEAAPFDRILISAACKEIPKNILNQLKNKGLLVAPVGSRFAQSLIVMQKTGNKFKLKRKFPGFIFVPFI